MYSSLKGKVAIVTGGGRDIGQQIALKLAANGASVCLTYYGSKEGSQQTLDLIKAAKGKAIAVQGDMTKAKDVEKLVSKCVQKFGDQVHILVNVAGGLVARKTMEDMDEAFWDSVMDLNVKSAFLVTKRVLPHMSAGSSIINFSSQAARDGGGGGAIAYATSKGAVATFTRGLAKELGGKGIRVNALAPGMISTGFHDKFTKPEIREKVAAGTPLKREGQAAEVADLVVYLASDAATFVTGALIDINGGTYFS
jgi:3-oxoacyl-[acyl-carrier protein] reductase